MTIMSRVSSSAAKSATRKSATYLTFSDWLALAERALANEHTTRPNVVRPGAWTKMYVRGMTPEEAAQRAATEARNKLPPSARNLIRGR
jgi:hypothetical protein